MATQTTQQVQDPNTPKYEAKTGFLTDYGASLGSPAVQPGDPKATGAIPTPTTPVVPPVAPTVPVRTPQTVANPLTTLQNKLATELTSTPDTSTDRNAITSLMNARIAEIQSRIDAKAKAEQEAGTRAEAQAGAINIRAGLAGSDFAMARTERVKTKTKEAISAIQAQGQTEKDAVYAQQEVAIQNIEDRALTRQQQRIGVLQSGIQLTESEQANALNDFTVLAKAGNDWSKIENTPGLLDELQNQTGKSLDFLKFTYQANLPKDTYTELNYHWENGNLVAVSFDKSTGKVSTQNFSAADLGIPEGTDIKVLPADDYGNVYWYDAKELASGNAKLNKLGSVGVAPKAPTAPTADDKDQAEVQRLQTVFSKTPILGSDGYVDPSVYIRERQNSTLSTTDFDNRFGSLINPESYNLVFEKNKPKTAGATGEKFLTKEFLTTSYAGASVDSMLEAMDKERKDYSKFFQTAGTEEKKIKEDFNSYITNTMMPSIEQLQKAGYTDQEIYKMMQ